MGLLADRSSKQRWSKDPRGKQWSEDKNKVSVKIMEKMGWTQGKGLGAKEDGNTEHVKMKFKDDNRGVGCSMKYDRQWIAHQDSFNDLLAGLNSEQEIAKPVLADKVVVSSLEKTGDKSGHRYRKFTKGKDLTNASSKHLEEIFGRSTKSVENDRIKKEREDAALEAKRNRNKSIVCETGTFQESAKHVVQEESVADYFKRKMAEKLKPKAIEADVKREPEEEDMAEEQTETVVKKAKKKKKSKEVEEIQEDENSNEERPKKKKKKRKKQEEEEEVDSEESSKKRKLEESEQQTTPSEQQLDTEEQQPKKRKKKKKEKAPPVAEEEQPAPEDEQPIKKKKKKKKSKPATE